MARKERRRATAEAKRRHRAEVGLVVVAVALVAALSAAEEFSPRFRAVTDDRPVTTGVVSSLVLALFAIAVIDRHLTSRAAEQWESARAVQLQGINHDLRVVRDTLVALSTGEVPFEPLDPDVERAVEGTAAALGRAGSSACKLCRSKERTNVLGLLMADPAWVETVYPSLRSLGHWFRSRVNGWLLNGSPSQVSWDLAHGFSEVARAVEDLPRPMYPVHRDADGSVRAEGRARAAEFWEKVVVATIAVEEITSKAQTEKTYGDATRMARESNWNSAARYLIMPSSATFFGSSDFSVASLQAHLSGEGLSPRSSSVAVPAYWGQYQRCGPGGGPCPTAAGIVQQMEEDGAPH